MLGQSAFYHNIIRKYIVAFGSLFNDIHVIRTNADGTEFKDIKVPITFASKDKTRYQINSIHSRTNEQVNIGAIIPRISYILSNDIQFDSSRVLNPLLQRKSMVDTTDLSDVSIGVGRPFNFSFTVSIWTKYHDDMFQIIEQMLCFFNPDYTVTIKEIPELDIESNIPIVFQGCAPKFETEFNDTSWRVLSFDMMFTLKGWIYPPIKNGTVINNIRMNFHNKIEDSKVVIIKNEYDDEDGLFYSAIVNNTESFFTDVDEGASIKPYAQVTLNVYKTNVEPILGATESEAYWLNSDTGVKYIIRKTGSSQQIIPY